MVHRKPLLQQLLDAAVAVDPTARPGETFGWPAVYLENRLIACVFGEQVAVKVPQPAADEALASGRFVRFRPHGLPTSANWVEMDSAQLLTTEGGVLMREAVDFARQRSILA